MADVEVTYNNNTIVELSASGTKTLKTAGKYCEDDIVLTYEESEGGYNDWAGFIFPFQNSTNCLYGGGTCVLSGAEGYVDWSIYSDSHYSEVRDWTGIILCQHTNYSTSLTASTDMKIGNSWTLDFFVDWLGNNDNGKFSVSFAGFKLVRKESELQDFKVHGVSVNLKDHTYSHASHMAFVYTGVELRIFENGVLVDTKEVALEPNPQILTLAHNYINASYVGHVVISNLRLVNKVLGTASSFPVPESLYTGEESVDSIEPDIDPIMAINFYDYDGTLVTQWPLSELQAKTALPTCPTHTGLTSQGWNWTLADLKSVNHAMNVGAVYIPSDGKTHLIIAVPEKDTRPVTFQIGHATSFTTTVNWGDGSSNTTVSGSGSKTLSHTYSKGGSYEVTISVPSGKKYYLGNSSGQFTQRHIVKRAHIGNGASWNKWALANCSALETITLRNGLTFSNYIESFAETTNLKAIVLPSGMTSLPQSTFGNCTNLKMVSFPNSMQTVGASVFGGNPACEYAFFGNNLTSIGNGAFDSCRYLKAAILPNSLTSCGTGVFNNCIRLKSVTIPGGLTTISSSMFKNCRTLTDVTLLPGVQTIGDSAFYACDQLHTISIPSTVTSVSSSAFYGCRGLNSITLPSGVTAFTTDVFYNCDMLRSLTVNGQITTVLGLNYCRSLEHLYLPDSVTSLGASAFYECRSLREITIGPNVTSIGEHCFYRCAHLEHVYFKGTTPPTIANSNAFSQVAHIVFHVPRGYLSAYTSATNYPSSSSYTYVEEDYT